MQHASDCAVHNAPALPPGPCDCGAEAELATLRAILRALVDSIESQIGPASELDPVDGFVQAMRDAKSWLQART